MSKNAKSPVTTLIRDAENLATESAFAEVWALFEQAMSHLEAESSESSALFASYLDGKTESELAAQNNLSEKEVRTWIRKIKRDLNQQLRQSCKVRQ